MGEYFFLLPASRITHRTIQFPIQNLHVFFSDGLKQRNVKKTTNHLLLPRLNEWNFVPINLSLLLQALNVDAKERRPRGLGEETGSILG